MNTVEIPHTKDTFYLPSSFADCDRQQARDVSAVLYHYTVGILNVDNVRLAILYALLNIKDSPRLSDENRLKVNQNLFMLSEELDGFFDLNDEGQLVINTDHVDNPFKWLRPRWVKYHGPSDTFENITFGAYVDALNAFCDFAATQDTYYLQLLVAILFSRKGTLSRKRLPYNRTDNKINAQKFRHLDIGYLFGFYLYFASFQKYLMTASIYWEGRELDLSILFKSLPGEKQLPKSDYAGLGFLSVKLDMASSGVFGTMEELDNTPFWDVITHMYDIRKKDLDEQARNKSKS